MRRVISLSLMILFSLALMTPFFAPDADSKLPACCRRSGKHHCMMRLMGEGNRREPGFTTVTEKCPCSPFSASVAHSQGSSTDAGDEFYAEIRRHPACAPQTIRSADLHPFRSLLKTGATLSPTSAR